jgi:hypothetical protein
MHKHSTPFAALALSVVVIVSSAMSQGRPDPQETIAAQKEAMMRFAIMDGAWRGEGWTMLPSGEKRELIQTERVGPALEGSVRVIEGRGYEKDGTVGFNALGIISYDLKSKSYSMRSYAQGQVGDFVITPTHDGFMWEIPTGPMTVKYIATIMNGTWHETGDRIMPGKSPVRFFEMTLTRIGDTDWPSGHAIQPKIDRKFPLQYDSGPRGR